MSNPLPPEETSGDSLSAAARQVGRYTIHRELGRGAMGVVYLAEDPAIARMVAVKTVNFAGLPEGKEGRLLLERLLKEARSAGKLSHPGIVTVYDIGQSPHMAYVVMEYIEGMTLQQRMSDGLLSVPEVIHVLEQGAAALDYAHRGGVLHRDIKPANIIISDAGITKILDFGIARLTAQQTVSTNTILGTPSYMAPEQVSNKALSGASDQFSLAVMAFEMLAGEKPFQSESLTGLMFAIVYEEPRALGGRMATVAPEVEQTLRRALFKKPEERFANCSEFVSALRAAFGMEKPAERSVSLSSSGIPVAAMDRRPTGTTAAPTPVAQPAPAQTGPVPPATVSPPVPVALPPKARVQPPPVETPPKPADPAKSGPNWMLIGGGIAAAAVIGVFLMMSGGSKQPETQPATTNVSQPSPQSPASSSPAPTPKAAPRTDPPKPAASDRKTPPPEPVATTAGPGKVSIRTTPPGASIRSGDKSCTSPCELEFKSGAYRVTATLEGYRPETASLNVPQQTEMSLTLSKPTGTLVVSGVAGATVTVDGAVVGQTPLELKLTPGDHKVVVERGGKKAFDANVKILEGDFREITAYVREN